MQDNGVEYRSIRKVRHEQKVEPKMTGEVLADISGLTISGKVMRPKRRGKIRVLIQIRADTMDDLRVSQCLSYTRGVDIRFETDTLRNNAGLIL